MNKERNKRDRQRYRYSTVKYEQIETKEIGKDTDIQQSNMNREKQERWAKIQIFFTQIRIKRETKEIGKDTNILQSNINKERNKRDRQRYRHGIMKYKQGQRKENRINRRDWTKSR
jgi:hypothetical protein